MAVTIDDIRAAAAAIEGAVERTPCARSRTLSEITGADLVLKFENHQYTASFKERGALYKLLGLSKKQAKAGVVAMSAGNHAQGLAYHARRLGIPATIVMPRNTPFVKVEATAHFEARILLEGEDVAAAEDHARRLAEAQELTLVHPYDDARVIAGQGTVALEMLDAFPDLEILLVPVGGGGLIAGTAIAAKALNPDIAVIGVQSEVYPSMYNALHDLEPAPGGSSVAEGIAVRKVGALTRPIVARLVEEILLVDEAAIEWAVMLMLEVEKTVAEGAGAAALAAVLAHPKRFAGRRVGLIVSGGNIDPRRLSSIILHGLVRAGRLVRLEVELSDEPGSLARVADLIGAQGGNIVEVYHERTFSGLTVNATDLTVVLETRSRDHAAEIMAALAEAGYRVRRRGGEAERRDIPD